MTARSGHFLNSELHKCSIYNVIFLGLSKAPATRVEVAPKGYKLGRLGEKIVKRSVVFFLYLLLVL